MEGTRTLQRTSALFMAALGMTGVLAAGDCYAAASFDGAEGHVYDQTTGIWYETLHDALASAPAGATLMLSEGRYEGPFEIKRPLSLYGSSLGTTVICGCSSPNGYMIHVSAPKCTLNNLTVWNSADGLYTTAVKVTGTQATIQQCSFADMPLGIALWSSQALVSGCTFRDCTDEGIAVLGSLASPVTNITITDCNFVNNCDGIELQHALDTTIAGCRFMNNTHAGVDVIATGTAHTTVSNCTFEYNKCFGVYLANSRETVLADCRFLASALHLTGSQGTLVRSAVEVLTLLEDSTVMLHATALPENDHLRVHDSVLAGERLGTTVGSFTLGSVVLARMRALLDRFLISRF